MTRGSPPMALAGSLRIGVAVLHATFGAWFGRRPLAAMLSDGVSRRAITTLCAVPAALFLVLIGVLHGVVNVSELRRAIERGQITARFADAVLVNAAFSGAALSLLGLIVLLCLPGLLAGSRETSRVATAIGLSVAAVGAAGYLWSPTQPSVLIFLFFGALLAAPLLVWRREFSHR